MPALSAEEADEILQVSKFPGLVVTTPALHATRIARSVHDQPESITIITAEDIERRGIVFTLDIFRLIPGFRVTQKGQDRVLSYHGNAVRISSKMEVRLDGRTMVMSDDDSFNLDILPIDARSIAKVTVIRGPNGANYGGNAFIVSISIDTKDYYNQKNGASYTTGENNTKITRVFSNLKGNNYRLSLNASQTSGNGYDRLDDTDIKYPNDYATKNIYTSLIIEPTATLSFDFKASIQRHNNDFPTPGEPAQAADFFHHGQNLSTIATYLINKEQLIEISLSRDQQEHGFDANICFPQALFTGAGDISDPDIQAQLIAIYGPTIFSNICGDLNSIRHIRRRSAEVLHRFAGENFDSIIGSSLVKNEMNSPPFIPEQDFLVTDQRYFYENQYRTPNRRYTLSAGLMYEDSKQKPHSALNWRTAVSYHTSSNSSFRLTKSHSERQPSTLSLFRSFAYIVDFDSTSILGTSSGQIPSLSDGNPDLKNETLDSYSLGYLLTADKLYFDFKLFYDEFSNSIYDQLDPFDPLVENVGNETQRGFEAALKHSITEFLDFHSSYSYIDSSMGIALIGRHQGSAIFDYQISPTNSLSVGYVGNSAIAGHSYDRYDIAFTNKRRYSNHNIKNQLVYSRHIGGVDGRNTNNQTGSNQSRFTDLNHLYYTLQLEF